MGPELCTLLSNIGNVSDMMESSPQMSSASANQLVMSCSLQTFHICHNFLGLTMVISTELTPREPHTISAGPPCVDGSYVTQLAHITDL